MTADDVPDFPLDAEASDDEASEFDIIQNDPRVRVARKAIEVDNDLRTSPAVKLILQRAFWDAVDALQEMVKTDPEDAKAMRNHQNTYLRSMSIKDYLVASATAGQQAEQEIEAEERDNQDYGA